MIITNEIHDILKENKANNKLVVLKDFCKDVPSWQEIIDYIDKSSNVTDSRMPAEPNEYDKALGGVYVGNVLIKQNFYFYLAMHGHVSNATEEIEKAFQDIYPDKEGGLSSMYVNFSSNLSNIPQHFDAHDNFHWQCIGSTTWHCEDKTYVVNPGDMVYIPSKSYHGVDFSMPRAAIGFSWNLD
jgi:mannose-6-phosphate isomerase-like protein (cupin superfamily)